LNKTVDLDFNAKRRDEVFAHLYDKYKNGFAHIGTHGTLQAKNAFKDVCRIFNVPFQEANTLSSLIPDGSESIEDALKDEKFSSKINADENLKDVVRYSKALEGTIKSYGCHACLKYDQKIFANGKFISLEKAYDKYYKNTDKKDPIKVRTINGDKFGLIHQSGRKNSYNVYLYAEDERTIISEVELSSEHKILIDGRYIPYRDLRENTYYEHNISNTVPNSITGYFISGFLLPLLSNNIIAGSCDWVISSETINLIFDSLEAFYVGGHSEFKEEWKKNINNPKKILSKIESILGITNCNGVILQAINYNDILFSEILERTDFFSGLISSSRKISSYSYGHKNVVSSSIAKQFNFEFKKFGMTFKSSSLEFSSADLIRFLTYNDCILFFIDLPKTYIFKGSKTEQNAVRMYDVQILTDNPDNQNFICSGISVSNCGVLLSPVPLNETIPLFAVNGLPTTMYDGETCEKLKFI
jgi:hypothetical protein